MLNKLNGLNELRLAWYVLRREEVPMLKSEGNPKIEIRGFNVAAGQCLKA